MESCVADKKIFFWFHKSEYIQLAQLTPHTQHMSVMFNTTNPLSNDIHPNHRNP